MAGEGRGVRIPAPLAVALWFGSALAVTGYVVIAFVETSSGTPSLYASPPGRGPVKSLIPKLLGTLPEFTEGDLKQSLVPLPPLKNLAPTPPVGTSKGKFTPSPAARGNTKMNQQ